MLKILTLPPTIMVSFMRIGFGKLSEIGAIFGAYSSQDAQHGSHCLAALIWLTSERLHFAGFALSLGNRVECSLKRRSFTFTFLGTLISRVSVPRTQWFANYMDNGIARTMNQLAELRQRIAPQPGDPYYLHLSDLLIAIRALVPVGASRVLDYGCGLSPYRRLFGTCVYHRADLTNGSSNLDFQYGPDLRLPPEAVEYDCVLSTQVLEHVTDPDFLFAGMSSRTATGW